MVAAWTMATAAAAAALALPAAARPSGEDYDKELAQLDHALKHPAASPGLDTARGGALKWCSAVTSRDETWPSSIAGDLDSFRRSGTQQVSLIEAARGVCTVRGEPVYQRAAVEVLQLWINETGLSEADAVASLTARVDKDAWEADYRKLCDGLVSNDGRDDEPHALADARWRLFECDTAGDEAAWMRQNSTRLTQLAPFLDGGEIDHGRDEIARYAYVTEELTSMLEADGGGATALAPYAVVQIDIAALSPDHALAQLDDAPYHGNRVAKIVMRETIAHAKLQVARVEAAIAKQDAPWRKAVVDAPRAAVDAWRAAVAKHRDMIDRVDKAGTGAGCVDAIRAELAPMLKAMPHAKKSDLEAAVSDDLVAGRIARMYGRCLQAQADREVAREWNGFADSVNAFFGPRGPAYLAVMAASHSDRHRDAIVDSGKLYLNDPHASGWGGRMASDDDDFYAGVIASVSKSSDGTSKVTFKTERYQYTQQKCVETNKIDRVQADGKVVYRQDCHDAGKAWAETTPGALEHVPAACTAGLKVGRAVYPDKDMPGQVFVDKAATKLAALHCFSLE
jgi:hypothetical protein